MNTKPLIALLCAALLVPGNLPLLAEDAAPAPAAQTASLNANQLDNLVAPIALYPDSLLSQVLVASTYPLEIVQAYQWLQQHAELKGEELTTAAQQQSWDPSIQALVVFPDVLKRLNEDVSWTTNLGNAFLASQGNVMDAVQRMRVKAQQSGKLTSTEQQKVTTTTDEGQPVVEIEPTNPQVVYVPEYDPAWVWGPSIYYPYPGWYYGAPRPGVFFWFGPAIFLSAAFIGCCGGFGWGWGPRWHDRTIIVNNGFISRYNFNHSNFATVHGQSVWVHNGTHRLGVAYPNRAMSSQFRAPMRTHPEFHDVQRQMPAAAARVRAAGVDRIGNRDIQAGARNRTAFGGVHGGATARSYSNRGYSSLGHARAATHTGSSSSGAGGGMHSGGGWSGGGHGGGGMGGGHEGGGGGMGGGMGGGGGHR